MQGGRVFLRAGARSVLGHAYSTLTLPHAAHEARAQGRRERMRPSIGMKLLGSPQPRRAGACLPYLP